MSPQSTNGNGWFSIFQPFQTFWFRELQKALSQHHWYVGNLADAACAAVRGSMVPLADFNNLFAERSSPASGAPPAERQGATTVTVARKKRKG